MHTQGAYTHIFSGIFNLESITHADKLVSVSDTVPDFSKHKLLHVMKSLRDE